MIKDNIRNLEILWQDIDLAKRLKADDQCLFDYVLCIQKKSGLSWDV